ncbi:hypothetical protein J2S31_000260 [Nitrospina gracilis Nb-211]|nr:hypothetical protein [Nitrospina gracilis Nb-211]
MKLDDFDFIDFGSSKGGCIEFAKARLGGVRGLGIDIDPKKVKAMRDNGYDCLRDDITASGLSSKSVRFVMMSHILEHLPSLESVQEVISEAARLARDFLFIQGPYFDADNLLEKLGFRFFWSKWTGHRCHLTTSQLRDVLLRLQLSDHWMFVRQPVVDSSDPSIHPLGSPVNSLEYNPEIHPPKPLCTFSPPVFKEMVCYVRLRPMPKEAWEEILRARRGCQPLDTDASDKGL